MQRLGDFAGRSVVLADGHRPFGKVTEVLLDARGSACLALVVRRGWLWGTRIIPFGDVQTSRGGDVVARTTQRMMDSRTWRARGIPALSAAGLRHRRVVTRAGREVGRVKDAFVDEHTGELTGYIVVSNGVARLLPRPVALDRPGDVTLSGGVLVVSDAAGGVADRLPRPPSPRLVPVPDCRPDD
jgi:uncharacterized protein YrrD